MVYRVFLAIALFIRAHVLGLYLPSRLRAQVMPSSQYNNDIISPNDTWPYVNLRLSKIKLRYAHTYI